MKTLYERQAHYLRIAIQGHTIRGLAELLGIEKSRMVRIVDGETPVYLWEVYAIAEFTNVKMLLAPPVMKELQDEALSIKYPNRATKLLRPFNPEE